MGWIFTFPSGIWTITGEHLIVYTRKLKKDVYLCVYTPEVRLVFPPLSPCTSGFLGRAGLLLPGWLMRGLTLIGCGDSALQLVGWVCASVGDWKRQNQILNKQLKLTLPSLTFQQVKLKVTTYLLHISQLDRRVYLFQPSNRIFFLDTSYI